MKSIHTATAICADHPVAHRVPYFRHLAVAALLAAAVGLSPSAAEAKGPPDGKTPSKEDVCDALQGDEFGLCNAYCEATDCGDGVNYASFRACASLQKNWQKKTGLDQLPCECEESEVFLPDVGCGCGQDLVVRIVELRPPECPTADTCTHEMDIEVENLGSLDIVDAFDVLVELPGVGLGNSVDFPTGLAAGTIEQVLAIPLGPGANCFDPNCDIEASVDPGNVIEECDETNNTDFLVIDG